MAARHAANLPVWRQVDRLRCTATTHSGRRCGGKPGYVSLVRGIERRNDFQVTKEITILDDAPASPTNPISLEATCSGTPLRGAR
jgi:hypothetical protein